MWHRNAPAFVVLAAVLAACAAPIDHETYRKHEDDHHHADGELLVLDPPKDYLVALPEMGLAIHEVTELPALGSKLYHVRVADDRHAFVAREHHKQRFPDVKVDVHHHFTHHATSKKRIDKSYTARGAAQWQKAGRLCGKGIRIGVIDGHVDTRHAAFKGLNIKHKAFNAKGTRPPNGHHGTGVTAVLAGVGSWGGLLPGAEYRTANVFHRNKAGKTVGSSKAILHAIDWMIAEKVSVINMSFGGAPNDLVGEALKQAYGKGIVLVASGGNAGPFTKKKSFPAAFDEVIAVTALDRFERSARFSSKGEYLEFAAPGVDIWTAVPRGGKPMSGTSFAAPIIAGFAAAAQHYKKAKGPEAVRAYLRKHAKDKTEKGRDKYTGWGLVLMGPLC